LYVIDDVPAYQIAYHSDQLAPGNLDVYSLRETYGVVDPTRTLRLTAHAAAERQPAYSLDRSEMTYVSSRDGSDDVFLATGMGLAEQNVTLPRPGTPFASPSTEVEPAFSPVTDPSGVARAVPDGRRYLGLTTDASGSNRLVFVDLAAPLAAPVMSFPQWAIAQGAAGVAGQLEPPNTEQSQIAFAPDGRKVAFRYCDLIRRQGMVRLLILDGPNSAILLIGPPIPIEAGSPATISRRPSRLTAAGWRSARTPRWPSTTPLTPVRRCCPRCRDWAATHRCTLTGPRTGAR
jgi:hypothetical protein